MIDINFIKIEYVVLVYNYYIEGLTPEQIMLVMSIYEMDIDFDMIEKIIDGVNEAIL